MDFTFNIRTDSNADLPRQLLVNSVNKQELRIKMYNYVKLVQHLIMSSIQVSTYARYSRRLASFSMQWVFTIVHHFVLFCRPGTQNNLLFLNAKANSNSTKDRLCTSVAFGFKKIAGFLQHLNSDSVTPLLAAPCNGTQGDVCCAWHHSLRYII